MKKDKICIELKSPTNGSDLNTSYSLIEYCFLFIHQSFTQLIELADHLLYLRVNAKRF